MLNKNNTNLGIVFLQNLMEFFGYSDTYDDEIFEIGIKKAIDIYKYMNTLYLTSMQKMEVKECKQIVIELETILNKITNLIDAINTDADPTLIEALRLERNTLMETKTKLLKEELETKGKKEGKK
ncbi:Putative cytosolic protein (plasmid) [Borrelia hermsii YBT]|uniref:BlyB family putative holin accessory protein n=1 Tax=Borrelia hermsii TaxID=140 RepID=UPI0003E37E7C|nr:BlyB family putative holin accessory protein [Borrelia hermsii]AHH12926.1 Putative cytosolic protein [Borrelia hermsii YBT]